MDRRRDIDVQQPTAETALSPDGRRVVCDLPERIGILPGEIDLVDAFLGSVLSELLGREPGKL